MDIEETVIGYSEAQATDPEALAGEPERTPDLIYSLGFNADELLVAYAALRTYLRGLVSQDNEDFSQIQRVVKLLITLRPRVVKASKALSLKAVGMEER